MAAFVTHGYGVRYLDPNGDSGLPKNNVLVRI